MSTPTDILLNLQTQLKNSAILDYIEDTNIFLGWRENPQSYPCLFLEPLGMQDAAGSTSGRQYLKMRVAIIGLVKLNTGNKDETIADTSLNTALKLENDIKKAIDADQTINQKAYSTNYQQTIYDFSAYPVRGVQIEIEVMFKQDSITRT